MSSSSPKYHLRYTATAAIFLLSLFLHLPPTTTAQSLPPTTLSFPSFNSSVSRELFNSSIYTGVSAGALQVTPDTSNNISYLLNKSGRFLLTQPFTLWTPSTPSAPKRLASFHTNFTLNVYRINGSSSPPGEGIAFLISPGGPIETPPGSSGGYLGLTNSTTDGQPSNHFVAVELDTVKQPWDPDSNHIGLNVNSVKSVANASLTPLGIEICPPSNASRNIVVWVDYDGSALRISIHVAYEGDPRPAAPVINASLDLSSHVLSQSYFGFAAATSDQIELNCVKSWNLTVEILPVESTGGGGGGSKPGLTVGLAVGISLLVVFLLMGMLAARYMRRRKVGDDPNLLAGTLKSLPGMPREFDFKVLRRATDNFAEHMRLGQGGFGIVYRGILPGEQTEIAVKKFSRADLNGQDDFLKELTIINRLRHKHLVPLLGWCHRNGVLLLVYQYMTNGSLDQHLFGGPDCPILSWERRYIILTGLASALHYLHNEYDQTVIHRDLKASNVMLDATFSARLGDFGLARALETDKTSYAEIDLSGVPGTMGYIAPECFHTGKATRESDVFGFGAVVLEVACGRRPRCDIGGFQFLADWVWKLYREGRVLDAVDPRLGEEFGGEEAERLLLLGLACSHPSPGERPKTEAIVQIISGSVETPAVPPFKPAFVWPSVPADGEGSSGMTSTVMTSSYYASSAAWTPQYLSREEEEGKKHVELADVAV